MHSHGLAHEDLSPSNVTLMTDGTLTIIDFNHAHEHECSGVEKCWELRLFAHDLGLQRLPGRKSVVSE